MTDSNAQRHIAELVVGAVDQDIKPMVFLKNGLKFQVKDAVIHQETPGILNCKTLGGSDLFVVINEIAALVSAEAD